MARLGVWSGRGPQLDLHQPTFDLDERALAVGVRVMVNTSSSRRGCSSLTARRPLSYVPGPTLLAGPRAQIVHVIGWRTGDFGCFGHHAEVARRRDAALPRVDDVQPRQHRIGVGVRRHAVDAAANLLVDAEFGPSQRSRFASSSLVMS